MLQQSTDGKPESPTLQMNLTDLDKEGNPLTAIISVRITEREIPLDDNLRTLRKHLINIL